MCMCMDWIMHALDYVLAVTVMQGLCKDGRILAGLCKGSAWTGLCRVYVKMIQGLYSQNTLKHMHIE